MRSVFSVRVWRTVVCVALSTFKSAENWGVAVSLCVRGEICRGWYVWWMYLTAKSSVCGLCNSFLKSGTVVRSPLNLRAVPKASPLSKTRLCGLQVARSSSAQVQHLFCEETHGSRG